MQSFSAKPA
jgi:hypothetical protein